MNANHKKILFCPPVRRDIMEKGTLALLARYVADATHASYIRCNGLLLQCDRDIDNKFHRTFETCLSCMKESESFGHWSGATQYNTGTHISSADIERTKRWVSELKDEELSTATFDGCTPFEWIKGLFLARFGQSEFDSANRQHELFVRRYILTVTRVRLATRRILFSVKPDFVCAIPHSDIQASACIEAGRDMGARVIEVAWNAAKRVTIIEDWQQNRRIESDLVIQDPTHIQNDPAHWPSELISRLSHIAEFLGIQGTRISKQSQMKMAYGG